MESLSDPLPLPFRLVLSRDVCRFPDTLPRPCVPCKCTKSVTSFCPSFLPLSLPSLVAQPDNPTPHVALFPRISKSCAGCPTSSHLQGCFVNGHCSLTIEAMSYVSGTVSYQQRIPLIEQLVFLPCGRTIHRARLKFSIQFFTGRVLEWPRGQTALGCARRCVCRWGLAHVEFRPARRALTGVASRRLRQLASKLRGMFSRCDTV